MSNKHGDFIWYELMAPDAGASATFYADLLGWEVPGGDWVINGIDPQGAMFALIGAK
jgi:predicted enzyme related to lactoylglutathione lyase